MWIGATCLGEASGFAYGDSATASIGAGSLTTGSGSSTGIGFRPAIGAIAAGGATGGATGFAGSFGGATGCTG